MPRMHELQALASCAGARQPNHSLNPEGDDGEQRTHQNAQIPPPAPGDVAVLGAPPGEASLRDMPQWSETGGAEKVT